MTRLRAGLLASSALFLLSLGGCSEGCGESPKEKAPAPVSSGGGGGSSSSGGGNGVAIGAQTMAAGERGAAEAIKAAPSQAIKPEAIAPKPEIENVTRDDFKPKVLEAHGLVLLLTYAPESRPCRQAILALEGLLPELSAGTKIYRLEVHAPGHAELLPKGMTVFPVPAFALYEGGKVLSIKQGLPFSPRTKESDEAFSVRLRDWARTRLAQKSF